MGFEQPSTRDKQENGGGVTEGVGDREGVIEGVGEFEGVGVSHISVPVPVGVKVEDKDTTGRMVVVAVGEVESVGVGLDELDAKMMEGVEV